MTRRPKSSEEGESERDEFLDAVGHRIKLARVRARLTQKELAAALGTQQSWVYLAEDGQQNLQLSSLRKLAQILDTSVRDLLPEGPETGPEYDAAQETSEAIKNLISQLTDAIGQLHRVNALTDRRKGPGRLDNPLPKPRKRGQEEN